MGDRCIGPGERPVSADNTYEASLKGKGKATMTSRNVVSKDGRTRTQTQTGTDAQGKAIHNTIVYDRQ